MLGAPVRPFRASLAKVMTACSVPAASTPRGMRPLVAHCHLGLGKLHRRIGKRDQAQEHFITATAMYREMDMRFWLEQAEAEMNSSA